MQDADARGVCALRVREAAVARYAARIVTMSAPRDVARRLFDDGAMRVVLPRLMTSRARRVDARMMLITPRVCVAFRLMTPSFADAAGYMMSIDIRCRAARARCLC